MKRFELSSRMIRFLSTMSTVYIVLLLAALRREPSANVLEFIGLALGVFVLQSQVGQRKGEAIAADVAKAKVPDAPPAP